MVTGTVAHNDAVSAPDLDSSGKPTEAAFAKARASRPEICGSYAPERPYPIYLRGVVEHGFGRGGKDLGCPTANLPSKVLQLQQHLQRTGIYYGFARVLPQDPDDPDLVDEDEQDANTLQPATNHLGGTDDDVDLNYDEDGDEVVLSASPVNDSVDGAELTGRRLSGSSKPRQLSKSSVLSSRSVKTILEKSGALDLERSHSGQSSFSSVAESSDPASKPTKETQGSASIPTEKHPRDTSNNSSQAGSLRHKKKRRVPISSKDARVFPMVMSVGWNPFYQNTAKTAEVHVINKFSSDFYGLEMRVVVLGYIRPEYNYVSKEALIDDIETDKKVAINSLARTPYQDYVADPFLLAPSYF